ncbi:MAG: hypothetical protein ACOC04_05495 [Halothece sp.]
MTELGQNCNSTNTLSYNIIEIIQRQEELWQAIDGIELRSLKVCAYKRPWKQVQDENGNIFKRGVPMAVCDKNYSIDTNSNTPYAQGIISFSPYQEIPLEEATKLSFFRNTIHHPKETKGNNYIITTTNQNSSCC